MPVETRESRRQKAEATGQQAQSPSTSVGSQPPAGHAAAPHQSSGQSSPPNTPTTRMSAGKVAAGQQIQASRAPSASDSSSDKRMQHALPADHSRPSSGTPPPEKKTRRDPHDQQHGSGASTPQRSDSALSIRSAKSKTSETAHHSNSEGKHVSASPPPAMSDEDARLWAMFKAPDGYKWPYQFPIVFKPGGLTCFGEYPKEFLFGTLNQNSSFKRGWEPLEYRKVKLLDSVTRSKVIVERANCFADIFPATPPPDSVLSPLMSKNLQMAINKAILDEDNWKKHSTKPAQPIPYPYEYDI